MKIILYLWQLPQHLIALVLLMFLKDKSRRCFNNITYYFTSGIKGNISLGNYIIISVNNKNTIKHEYGHSIQSKYLGWLYLIVIGIPSLL